MTSPGLSQGQGHGLDLRGRGVPIITDSKLIMQGMQFSATSDLGSL